MTEKNTERTVKHWSIKPLSRKRKIGNRTNATTLNVRSTKASQLEANLEAKQTEANMAAFSNKKS